MSQDIEKSKYLLDKRIDHIREVTLKTNPDFAKFSPEEQTMAIALYLERQQGESSEIQDQLDNIIYKYKPPTIEEFLTEKYIGDLANYYKEDSPWKRDLLKVFNPDGNILEWVLTGAIGTAKSSNSILAHCYNLFRLNCLKSPQAFMGTNAPGKALVFYFMSVTLKKVEETLLEPITSIIDYCPCYVKVKNKDEFGDYINQDNFIVPYVQTKDTLEFPNIVRVKCGSKDYHNLGDDIVSASLDEAEFRRGSNTEDVFETYSGIIERIRSRFINRIEYCLMTLVSSIGGETGIMNTYVREKQSSKDKTTHISQYAIWDIKPPEIKDESMRGNFYVLAGTKTHPSKLLDVEESERHTKGEFPLPVGCSVVEVPRAYLSQFKMNVEMSLRNLAGLVSSDELRLFDTIDLVEIESNRLPPVITIDADISDDIPILSKMPPEVLKPIESGDRIIYRYPQCLRYLHIDLAERTEGGLCLVHKERSSTFNQDLYVVDFAIRIIGRTGTISLESIKQFVHDLIDKVKLPIHTVTADQYQSTSLLQSFMRKRSKFIKGVKKCERLSVDKTAIPYNQLSSVISESRLRIGDLGVLKEQLKEVYLDDKNKPKTRLRKDVADALCGAVYNAIQNGNDVPTNTFENTNLTDSFSAVSDSSIDNNNPIDINNIVDENTQLKRFI